MSLQRTQTPGRWIRNCDNAYSDPCLNLSQADWNFSAWIFNAGGLDSICVEPNTVDGNIASITSYPDGGIYQIFGGKVATIQYNSSTGKYELTGIGSAKITPDGTFYAYIPAIPVQTNGGFSCTLDFLQYFSGNPIIVLPDQAEFTIVHTNSGTFDLTIDNSVGTIDWGDTTSTNYDASASAQTLSHAYSGSGPWTLKVYNSFDSSEIDIANESVTSINLQQAKDWDQLDISNNSALTSVLFPGSHNVAITNLDAGTCNITGVVDLLGLTTLGGAVDFNTNPLLTGILFPNSSNAITSLNINDCGITGGVSVTGLNLQGTFDANQNTGLTNINFGTQTGGITKIDANRCDLTSTLDLSSMTSLSGQVILWQNSNLTIVLNPTTSGVITTYRVDGCDITGTLDISGLSGLSGLFQCNDNSNLTQISNPTTSGVFTTYNLKSCNITGTLNLSTLTGLAGIFSCRSNPLLTAITNPTSSGTFSQYLCYACNLSTLDLSGLTGLGGLLQLRNNSSMTSITFPTSAVTTTQLQMNACDLGYVDITNMTFSSAISFQMENNNMTAGEVNHMLVDLDATLPGSGTGTITISGTNAAPDGTSGGYDGLTAKANLISKGYTVNTN